MRRKDKEITDPAQIESIIRSAEVGHVGLTDNGSPYVIPVSFAYEDGMVYIHCASTGRKIDILRKDNRVCFQVEAEVRLVKGDTPCRWSLEYKSVIGEGRAAFVEEAEQKKKALAAIHGRYSNDSHVFSDDEAKQVTILRIQFDSLTGKISPPPGKG